MFEECKQFDIIAFSLGGRIALNTIATNPSLIRRAHITGVSAERDPMAKIILASWKDLLSPKEGGGSLKPFAWSIILATYSDRFLARNGPEKVSSWVEHICFNHILIQMGLLSLLQQTGELEPIELADQIVRCRCSKIQIQLAVGGDDKISTCDQVEKLRVALELDNSVLIYKDCGHAVLNERAVRWRKDALEFLNR